MFRAWGLGPRAFSDSLRSLGLRFRGWVDLTLITDFSVPGLV